MTAVLKASDWLNAQAERRNATRFLRGPLGGYHVCTSTLSAGRAQNELVSQVFSHGVQARITPEILVLFVT